MKVDAQTGDSRRRAIAVAYAADDEVADADQLCGWLHGEIERHLLSITEVPIADWNLRASIEQCRMAPHHGSVRLALEGMVAGRPVERLITARDEPAPAGYTLEQWADKRTKIAVANAFTLLGRLLFPSELVRALGRRRPAAALAGGLSPAGCLPLVPGMSRRRACAPATGGHRAAGVAGPAHPGNSLCRNRRSLAISSSRASKTPQA